MRDVSNFLGDIRAMVTYIDCHATPKFRIEYRAREERYPSSFIAPNDELRRIALVYAYSGGVKARAVKTMIDGNHYDNAFSGFDIEMVRTLNPCDIYDNHWESIKQIKNESKLLWVVRAARVLFGGNSILTLLNKNGVPSTIKKIADVEAFWIALKSVEKQLKKLHFSGMQSVTSQLHFLLELGYDCVKPDRIVMDVAEELGMVDGARENHDLIEVTRLMQICALELKLRPALLDMYFLIQGRHTDAIDWTTSDFIPWQPPRAVLSN